MNLKGNKRLKLFGLVLACGLLLAGCGKSNEQSPTNSAPAGQTDGGSDEEKILTVAQIADAVSLDPHKANDSASVQPMRQIDHPTYSLIIDKRQRHTSTKDVHKTSLVL